MLTHNVAGLPRRDVCQYLEEEAGSAHFVLLQEVQEASRDSEVPPSDASVWRILPGPSVASRHIATALRRTLLANLTFWCCSAFAVAVTVGNMNIVNTYLPHAGHGADAYDAALLDLDGLLARLPGGHTLLGGDVNCDLFQPHPSGRRSLLWEFTAKWRLELVSPQHAPYPATFVG